MKKCKIFFILIMTFMLISSTYSFSFAESVGTISIGSGSGNPGGYVDVSLTITSDVDFVAAALVIDYDKEVFSFDPRSTECVFNIPEGFSINPDDGKDFALCDENYEKVLSAGTYTLILRFTIQPEAKEGVYPLTIRAWEDWSNTGIINDIWEDAETTLENGSITVSKSDAPSSNVLTKSNFSGLDENYFTNAKIDITPSDNDLNFTVACNKACVAAINKGDGTYTCLTGTPVDGGATFTASSADDQIVVAVKGDTNGDGVTDAADAAVSSAFEVGNIPSLTPLQKLVADINQDGSVDSADSAAAKAAEVGNLALPW